MVSFMRVGHNCTALWNLTLLHVWANSCPKCGDVRLGNELFRKYENYPSCDHIRLKDTQNLNCEDRRLKNCLVLRVEDLATKPEG